MNPKWMGWDTVRVIGEGSYGKVYEIQKNDNGNLQRAALKVISVPSSDKDFDAIYEAGMAGTERELDLYIESLIEQLTEEVNTMFALKDNDNIVKYDSHMIIDHEGWKGVDILIKMELLTALKDYQRTIQVNDRLIIKLGMDICNALSYCHTQTPPIIHRDIKPGNIMVDDRGNFKLGDFGVARTLEGTKSAHTKVGTESYMAPEVLLKRQGYGLTVDIYSLGMVLYRMLNRNRMPFLPATGSINPRMREDAQIKRLKNIEVPEPLNGNFALKKAVLKAIEFEPENRYQSAAEFGKALADCIPYAAAEPYGKPDTFSDNPNSYGRESDRNKNQDFNSLERESVVDESTMGVNQRPNKVRNEGYNELFDGATEAIGRRQDIVRNERHNELFDGATEAIRRRPDAAREKNQKNYNEKTGNIKPEKTKVQKKKTGLIAVIAAASVLAAAAIAAAILLFFGANKNIKIVWLNYDGTVLLSKEVEKDMDPSTVTFDGENPSHPADDEYIYEFFKWEKTEDKNGNITYEPKYLSVSRVSKTKITWKNWDGTVLESTEGDPDLVVYRGTMPKHDEDENYSYSFLKWEKTEEGNGNVTYTAVFSPVKKEILTQETETETEKYVSAEEGIAMYKNKDYSNAFPILKKYADEGDLNSKIFLGECYLWGLGCEKQPKEAVKCFQSAADSGYLSAYYYLGYCYENGEGVDKNETMAFSLYKKCADKGDVGAMNKIGDCYAYGIGVAKNPDEANKWYEKAAAAQ